MRRCPMQVARQGRFFSSPISVLAFVIAAVVFPSILNTYPSAQSSDANPRLQKPATTKRPGQAPPPCNSCPPPTDRKIYVPAIDLPEARTAEIVLNSRSPHVIEVTPTFYTETGDPIVGEPLQLQPTEIRFARIDSLIPKYNRHHRWGGMSLSYVGGLLEVWAQITFHGAGGSGSIDET